MKGQRQRFNDNLPFDTNLIITHRKHGFYSSYYDMCFSDEIFSNQEYKKVRDEHGDYYLEEFVVDYLYTTKFKNILPLRYYQYGEGYPSVTEYPRERIKDICFLHEHIYKDTGFPYDYDPVRERLNYLKLAGELYPTLKTCHLLTSASGLAAGQHKTVRDSGLELRERII